MTPNKQVRSELTKNAFIHYLVEHPDERFWQCVRNFSGQPFVMTGEIDVLNPPEGLVDTFYREEL